MQQWDSAGSLGGRQDSYICYTTVTKIWENEVYACNDWPWQVKFGIEPVPTIFESHHRIHGIYGSAPYVQNIAKWINEELRVL